MTARIRSLVIEFGWCGVGRTAPGDLFPEVRLLLFRVSWVRGCAIHDARQWRILSRDMRL